MTAPLSSKTILVVDDEQEITNAVKAILEDEGLRVITATDGVEALSTLSEHKPDLILMDVMMPRLSGYDVLRRLHEKGGISSPVILMSCVNPQVKQSDFKWQHFLKKPFTMDDLMNAVDHFIKR